MNFSARLIQIFNGLSSGAQLYIYTPQYSHIPDRKIHFEACLIPLILDLV